MSDPSLVFKDEHEMYSLLKEWQKRLWLSDWWIGIALVNKEELSNGEWAGESTVQWVNKCGEIMIRRSEDLPDDLLIKQPQELTLIHELLHFKFFGVEQANATIEGVYWDEMQHQLLEEMAKSLYMAKYGLDYGWFITESTKVKEDK